MADSGLNGERGWTRLRDAEPLTPAQEWHNSCVHSDTALHGLESLGTVPRLSPSARRRFWSRSLEYLYSVYLPSPFEAAFQSFMDSLVAECAGRRHGDPSIGFVYGPNGTGKSTLAQRWAADLYRTLIPVQGLQSHVRVLANANSDDHYCPIISIPTRAECRPMAFDVDVLTFVGLDTVSVTPAQRPAFVDRVLRQVGCTLLIVEDVHRMKSTPSVGAANADRLRTLSAGLARHGGTLLLVSNESPRWVLDRDRTLASRLMPFEVPALPGSTQDDQAAVQRFLRHAQEELSVWFPGAGDHVVGAAHAYYRASKGILRELIRAVWFTAVEAAKRGGREVDAGDLRNFQPSVATEDARFAAGDRT